MKTCAWDGCDRPARKRGHCNSHYERLRLNGRIAIDREEDAEVRYWRNVIKSEGCWTWGAALSTGGYGRVRFHGRLQQAHRVAYELLVGPIPEGLHLDHLCRNRQCVNPSHLEPVTPGENVARGDAPSAIIARTDTCKYGHALTGGNVRVDERGWRHCRACERRRANDANWSKIKPIKQATCIVCGDNFSYVGKLRQICSDTCRKRRAVQHSQAYQRRNGR